MATREELAEHLWQAIINPHLDPLTLDRVVAHCRRFPSDYLSVAYEAVFGTLYAIGDPGVDGDDVLGLYEILGGAPSADKTPGAT